jgi:hypothetical protein
MQTSSCTSSWESEISHELRVFEKKVSRDWPILTYLQEKINSLYFSLCIFRAVKAVTMTDLAVCLWEVRNAFTIAFRKIIGGDSLTDLKESRRKH